MVKSDILDLYSWKSQVPVKKKLFGWYHYVDITMFAANIIVADKSKWCLQDHLSLLVKSLFLVDGFNHLEKYEFVSWDEYSDISWKIKAMFETTNQWLLTIINHD